MRSAPNPWPATAAPRRPRQSAALAAALGALALLALAGFVALALLDRPAAAAYANDDYRPPPTEAQPPKVPTPTTYEQARQWTTDNTVYRSTMPAPVRCEVPRLLPRHATDAALQAHLEALEVCLLRDWDLPLRAAGYSLVRLPVNLYAERTSTPCGDKVTNAGFCVANQQFYVSTQLIGLLGGLDDDPWTWDVIMAHEFGHAVQGRSGIYQSTYALEDRIAGRSELYALNRRLENQADCFAGLFLRSVSTSIGLRQPDLDAVMLVYTRVGSDTLSGDPNADADHGRAATRRYWGTTGLAGADVGRCNTFVVPDDLNR